MYISVKAIFSTKGYLVLEFWRDLLTKYIGFCSGFSCIKAAPIASCEVAK